MSSTHPPLSSVDFVSCALTMPNKSPGVQDLWKRPANDFWLSKSLVWPITPKKVLRCQRKLYWFTEKLKGRGEALSLSPSLEKGKQYSGDRTQRGSDDMMGGRQRMN